MATRGWGRGSVYKQAGSRYWWIRYSVDGKERRESSKSTKKGDALALLDKRRSEARQGHSAHDARRVTLEDLLRLLRQDYATNSRRSLDRAEQAWAHVAECFGSDAKAVSITLPRLRRYLDARQEEGAALGTIKYELAILKHAFKRAYKDGTLTSHDGPTGWPSITLDNRREGFMEREEHEAIISALRNPPAKPAKKGRKKGPTPPPQPDIADLCEFLYWTGWRRGEALNLTWDSVRRREGVIRIETTKSGKPRTLPYRALPQLAELLERRWAITGEVQRKRGMVVSHVFHRNGDPIRAFRKAWGTATKAAGVPGRLVHDYRRSAARNLSRAGVPERVIMDLCGWATRSVFDRYNITNEEDLANGLGKLADNPPKGRKVAKLSR